MKKYIDNSLSYAGYLELIDKLLSERKTTGPNQSEAMVNFTSLNRQRMHRLDRTVELTDSIREAATRIDRKMIWLIVTEAWCGDAAQNISPIEKIASLNANIETRYVLRDENPELIDQFLTNGARSIPKLIALDAKTLEILGMWGARPEAAQKLFHELKEQSLPKPEIMERLQRWYNADKTLSLQGEFTKLVNQWGVKPSARASSAA